VRQQNAQEREGNRGERRPAGRDLPGHVLAASDPAPLMQWLATSSAARDLADISQAGRPPGHARYPASKAIRHLRKILVTGGILPVRDKRLA
jgi:hypothetical protein